MAKYNYDIREITHGNKQAFYAEVKYDEKTGEYSYGEVKPLTGLRSVSIETSQEDTNFYADDQVHMTLKGAKTTTGSITLYQIPKDFVVNHLGKTVDANGALIDNGPYKSFAFGFLETKENEVGAVTEVLHLYYNCKATHPSLSSTTDEDGVTAKELEIPLTINQSFNVVDGNGKAITEVTLEKTEANKDVFEQAFEAVYVPTFTDLP